MRQITILAFIGLLFIPAVTNAGVTRYYRFETNAGAAVSDGQAITAADDSSGNGNIGSPHSTPEYDATPFVALIPQTGTANQFSYLGGTGKGIILDAASAPVIPSTFTVEAFFRMTDTSPSTGDAKTIIRVRDGTGFPFELALLNLEEANGDGTNDLLLASDEFELRSFDLQINSNYHVAATYDGGVARLYVDGTLVDSAPLTFAGSGTVQGGIGYDPLVPSSSYFQGNIDELRISDVALSPSQFLNAVPEPASLSLILLGAALLCRGENKNP